MTREEFIKSDEYIIANVECIVRSHKSVLKTRYELNKFFLSLRDELLLFASQPISEPSPQLQQTPCSTLRDSLVQKKKEVLKAREQTKDSYEKAKLLDQWKDYQTALQVIEELQPVA